MKARSYFVRDRNALLVRGQFESIYVDHYLHLMQHSIQLEAGQDQYLKDAIAAMTLHLASRPWNEVSAWTIHFQDPLLNVFVTGDSRLESVVGRVFSEDVKDSGSNLFLAQVSEQPKPSRKSIVEFKTGNIFSIVEQFYEQSEQRPVRLFRHSEEDIVLVCAQPQCDMEWFNDLTDEKIRELDREEQLSLLETRTYRYDCGCTIDRILPALAPLQKKDIKEIFEERDKLKVTCPRCAAVFYVTEADIADYRARNR